MNNIRRAINTMMLLIAGLCGCARTADDAQPGTRTSITSSELHEAIERGDELLVLDVRTEEEFRSGHVPGAVLVPHDKIISAPGDLAVEPGASIVVYCESGYRAVKARKALIKAGFNEVMHLEGDMAKWRQMGLPLNKPKGALR